MLVELVHALATAFLLVGGVVSAVALGLLHGSRSAFIARLRRVAGPKATCGCFGDDALLEAGVAPGDPSAWRSVGETSPPGHHPAPVGPP